MRVHQMTVNGSLCMAAYLFNLPLLFPPSLASARIPPHAVDASQAIKRSTQIVNLYDGTKLRSECPVAAICRGCRFNLAVLRGQDDSNFMSSCLLWKVCWKADSLRVRSDQA